MAGLATADGTTQLAAAAAVSSRRPMTRMARGGTANLVGAAISAVCTFALTVAVARGLSRTDAGVFFSTTSIFLMATAVGQLGTQTGLVYFVSRCRAHGRREAVDGYLRDALRPVAAVGVAMAVALLVFARPLAEITSGQHVGQATTYLQILAPFIPVAVLEAAFLSATRGLGSMRASTLIEQVFRPAVQLILVIVATAAASTAVLGFAWSIGYVPAAAAAWLAWRRLRSRLSVGTLRAVSGGQPAARQSGAHRQEPTRRATLAVSTRSRSVPRHARLVRGASRFVEFWTFTLPRALTSIIQMLLQRFDVVLVGALAGAANAAVYAAATRFVVIGQLGSNALTLAAQPQLAERFSMGDRDAVNEVYQVSTAWLILVTWPLYLTFILFAQPLLRVFGVGYAGGRSAMVLLSVSMLVATGLGMVDTVLSMAGHTSWNLANAVLALAVNLGLDLWLIPEHGVLGAAIGWAAAIVVRNIAAVGQVGLRLGYHPFARSTGTASLLTVSCYALVAGLMRLLFGATLPGLVIGLVVATSLFLVGSWVLRRPLGLDALASLRKRG